MIQIGRFIQLQTKQHALELMHHGTTDDFTRIYTWLRIFGYLDNNLQHIVQQFTIFTETYQKQKYQYFTDIKPSRSVKFKYFEINEEANINTPDYQQFKDQQREILQKYITDQTQINQKQLTSIKKDIFRLQPFSRFYHYADNKMAVLRQTYILCEQLNVEHCQGFDDIAGILYQIVYDAFANLEQNYNDISQHENRTSFTGEQYNIIEYVYQNLILNVNSQDLLESVSYLLYKHIIQLIYQWFSDQPIQEMQQLIQQQNQNQGKNLNTDDDINFSQINELRNLSKLVDQILKEISPNTYSVLEQIQQQQGISTELIVCKLARTLFSRELPINQLKQLWDFMILNGYVVTTDIANINSICQLKSVAEFTAIMMHNMLQDELKDFPKNYDILVCQQILFEQQNQQKQQNLPADQWKYYIHQLQYITQQTSECFEVPIYARFKQQQKKFNKQQKLKLLNKYFYLPSNFKNKRQNIFNKYFVQKEQEQQFQLQKLNQQQNDISTLQSSNFTNVLINNQKENMKNQINFSLLRKWQECQLFQLDCASLLHQLQLQMQDSVQRNVKPSSDLYTVTASLKQCCDYLKVLQPNMQLKVVQSLGNKFQLIYEREILNISDQLKQLDQYFVNDVEAIKILKNQAHLQQQENQ